MKIKFNDDDSFDPYNQDADVEFPFHIQIVQNGIERQLKQLEQKVSNIYSPEKKKPKDLNEDI